MNNGRHPRGLDCQRRIANTCRATLEVARRGIRGWRFAICAATVLPVGCASLPTKLDPPGDVHAKSRERNEQAIREFETRRDNAQYQAAMSRWRSGGAAEARGILEEIVKRTPDHLPARLALAEALLVADQPALALEHAKFVVERAPNEAAPRHVEGLALEALGQTEAARLSFQQALAIDPDNGVYQLSLESSAGADDSLSAIRQTGPNGSDVASIADSPVTTASWSADLAADRSSSSGNQSAAQSAAPISPPSRVALSAAVGNDPQAALAAATELLQRNQTEQAEVLLNKAVDNTPQHAGLWRALGLARYRRGNYGQAQVALTKALSLDATQPLSYFLLGATLRQQGQTAEAEQNFARAAELDPRYAALR